MKKVRFAICILVFVFVAGFNAQAQEIEATSSELFLRSVYSRSTLKLYSSGTMLFSMSSSAPVGDAFIIDVPSASYKPLVIRRNWASPALFEVFGNGTVKANNVVLTSDANEKEQINELGSQMDKIKKLKAVSYKWKDKEDKGGKTNYGLLAQDLEKVYPDMVFHGDSGELGIYYTELIPVLLQVAQEQQVIIEKQAEQLLGFEERLAKLEKGNK